ncbi:organic solvent ABC transporter substrate-binding protein [Methylacidiphilum sp. Yel]|jgi:phospholipid/cholesterol/gamma-HCH transport system substrate-binding protein|uniref:MlaD family protein n=1 Tax=Methylacidiphilum sp. Yel TaxID=1847730 RepID=UPI001069EAC5|nr:MlaD family protein [Methylacidiphilum sp. Yel]TFE67747.1 organic solvent ABC transporter substrate-binding protein [Methylacidiphilum sp. Yel]
MEPKNLELKVGLFLLIGLAILGALIIYFGRYGEKFRPSYQITVEFPNAYGLIKGAPVYFAGAPVGRVISTPRQIREGRAVEVDIKINADAKIRKDALFQIVDVGMLGDKAIAITPKGVTAPFLRNGDKVRGTRASTLSDVTSQITPLINSATQLLEGAGTIVNRINQNVLTEETAADLRATIKELRLVLSRTDQLLADAQYGKGPLAKILNDPEISENLSAFVFNLRKKGILFYSDVAAKEEAKAESVQAREGTKTKGPVLKAKMGKSNVK